MYIGIFARKVLCDTLLFSMGIFAGLLIIGLPSFVLQRLMVYGIPYTYIPHLIFYIIPECLQYLFPLSLMMGVIITFAKMGSEKELLILKSSGIQPTRLVYPVLIMAFILSFGTWYLNDISAICRERGIRNVLLNGAEDIVKGMLKSNGEIKTRQLRIKVDSVESNGLLRGVSIHYMPSPTSTPIDIEAQTARIQTDKIQREFIIELSNCMFRVGNTSGSSYKSERYPFPIDAFLAKDAASNITNAPMMKELSALNNQIKETQESIAGDTSVILMTGEYSLYNSEPMQRNRSNLKNYSSTRKKASIEPFRRFTLGFACLSLVLFCAPLTIANADKHIVFNISTGAFLTAVLFLVLFAMGLNFGKQGLAPPWMICFADVVLIVIGFILLKYASNK